MRLLTRSLLTASVVALAAAVAWPQSLAEIAAREKERQEKVKKKTGGAAHVITEDDLRGRGAGTYSQPGAGAAPSASPSPGASPGAPKPKTEDEIRAEQEKAWRERLEHFQSEVTRLTGVVASIQSDLGDLTGPLYGGSRTALINRLDTAQKSLADARRQVEDLQEEGRRNRFR